MKQPGRLHHPSAYPETRFSNGDVGAVRSQPHQKRVQSFHVVIRLNREFLATLRRINQFLHFCFECRSQRISNRALRYKAIPDPPLSNDNPPPTCPSRPALRLGSAPFIEAPISMNRATMQCVRVFRLSRVQVIVNLVNKRIGIDVGGCKNCCQTEGEGPTEKSGLRGEGLYGQKYQTNF